MTRRASQRKFHFIYKTTCIITKKWYLGMHSTDNIDDGYSGSGVHLWKSIKKYGKENHITEILEYLPDRKSLSLREEELLCECVKDSLCMNIAISSQGFTDRPVALDETRDKMSASQKARWAKIEDRKRGPQSADVIANRVLKNTGQKRSENFKKKMSVVQKAVAASYSAEKRKQMNEKNSAAKSKKWIVEEEQTGAVFEVINLSKFAISKNIRGTMLHKTALTGKYVNGFRVKNEI